MLKFYTNLSPLKIAEIGQISTKNLNKGYPIPPCRVKRFLGHSKKPSPETYNIKGFPKMAIFCLKNGLKGVLRGCKGVVKIFLNFFHFYGFYQTPFFRLEVIR